MKPPCPAFGQRFSDKFPTAGIDIPPRGGGALFGIDWAISLRNTEINPKSLHIAS